MHLLRVKVISAKTRKTYHVDPSEIQVFFDGKAWYAKALLLRVRLANAEDGISCLQASGHAIRILKPGERP